MTSIAFFAISGTVVASIVAAKMLETRVKRPLFISKLISKSDTLVRSVYHRALRLYSEGKDKFMFFTTKQLPMRTKNIFYKSVSFLKEKTERHVGNIRNSRLLKKSDGISEFYKSISEIEKGNGEINDTFEDGFQNEIK